MNTNIISKYLQFLRKSHNYTQDDLAQKLGISRQAVSKWETGISIPDLEVLLKISKLYEVTINDILEPKVQLQSENDACHMNVFNQQQLPDQDIRMFLIRAKNNTYITGNNTSSPSKPASKDYLYSEEDYTYTDTYMGDEHFAGEEAVWIKGTPVYAMNYYGQILSENFDIAFLKEMLSLVSYERPFRGPEYHQKGDYAYHCRIHGDFNCFHGEEIIYCKQEKVYFCMFHGGGLS